MAALNMAAVIESHNEHNKLSPMTLIRELKEAGFEQWLGLYQVYAEHYRVALTETGIQTTWGWLIDSSHPLQGLVAVQEAALVGMAHFRAMPSPLRGQNIGFLDDLVVLPSALVVVEWVNCCWMNYNELGFRKAGDFSAGSLEITTIEPASYMTKLPVSQIGTSMR